MVEHPNLLSFLAEVFNFSWCMPPSLLPCFFFFYYKSSTDEQCKQIFKYLRSDNELRKQQGQSAHKELHDSSQVASYLYIISIDVI